MKPDFIVIGAMKCATSTLHSQLSQLGGVTMSSPKEPCYFSDDENYAKGSDWYADCFKPILGCINGESSTHYSKLPTHPETVSRMLDDGLHATKFVYILRDPIERLISQYVHEWTENLIKGDINIAIHEHPRLVEYSRYYYQLSPYLDNFPISQIKLVFFEALKTYPDTTLNSICRFIGLSNEVLWGNSLKTANISSERIRQFWLKRILIDSRPMTWLRRKLIPKALRTVIKGQYQMKRRPELSDDSLVYLHRIFDQDLEQLSSVTNLTLSTDSFQSIASSGVEISLND
jgi:hypothetical protein